MSGWRCRRRRGVRWGVAWLPRRFWLAVWRPRWGREQGPYVSVGLWLVAVYRGY